MTLTAANQLTFLRLLLVPALALCLLYRQNGWALVTLLAAGLTDGLDGIIARRTGQPTTLGAWLDPVADKLLLATMFVMLAVPDLGQPNRLPLWLAVLVISRDVAIVLTVAVVNLAIGPRTFLPTIYGKTATAIYVATGVVTLFFNYLGRPSALVRACVWAALAITIVSGLHYVVRALRILNEPSGRRAAGA